MNGPRLLRKCRCEERVAMVQASPRPFSSISTSGNLFSITPTTTLPPFLHLQPPKLIVDPPHNFIPPIVNLLNSTGSSRCIEFDLINCIPDDRSDQRKGGSHRKILVLLYGASFGTARLFRSSGKQLSGHHPVQTLRSTTTSTNCSISLIRDCLSW